MFFHVCIPIYSAMFHPLRTASARRWKLVMHCETSAVSEDQRGSGGDVWQRCAYGKKRYVLYTYIHTPHYIPCIYIYTYSYIYVYVCVIYLYYIISYDHYSMSLINLSILLRMFYYDYHVYIYICIEIYIYIAQLIFTCHVPIG